MNIETSSKKNKENEALNSIEELILNIDKLSTEEIKSKLQVFSKSHKKLLQEVKLLTSVGDRLQKKIKSANEMLQEQAEEIKKINKELQDKNIELQFTIDELTKAKAGKRATTIIFIFAIILFIITELLESSFESFFKGANMLIIYAFKISLALGFKPIEGLLESAIISQEMKRQRMELEKQQLEQELANKNRSNKLKIPKIEIKNSDNPDSKSEPNTDAKPSSHPEMSPEDLAKLERKLKREALKKMGENRE